jgi:hypothetical protein
VKDEYWATFSIYDHRDPVYRQSLVMFDRIVVPVPVRPIKKRDSDEVVIGTAEIDKLAREVEKLEAAGAAKKVDWDPEAFLAWRQDPDDPAVHVEAMAKRLVKDPPQQTRLLLKHTIDQQLDSARPPGVGRVTAVPVYDTRVKFDAAADAGKGFYEKRVMLEVLMKAVPLPDANADLDQILELRTRPSFRASLAALRDWQTNEVRKLIDGDTTIEKVASKFDDLVKEYTEALEEGKYKKRTTGVTSLLGLGAAIAAFDGGATALVGLLAAGATCAFFVPDATKPCWKDVKGKECFPAGVIYEARQL